MTYKLKGRKWVLHDPSERKKHKSHKNKSHSGRSPKLDLLGLGDQDCACFKEEPFEVMAEAMKAAGQLFKKYQEEEADRLAGRRVLHKISYLEDDLSDKSFKLQSALLNLIEMREDRDRLLKKLEEVEPKAQQTATYEQKLQEAETQLAAAVIAQTGAEATRDKALAGKVAAEEEIDRLNGKKKKLFDQVTSLKADLNVVEQERDKYKARFKEAVTKALGAAQYQFNNAVDQIKLSNPGLVIDEAVVNFDHCVVDQEIVRPQKVEKGKVVQKRAVIYRADPSS